MATHYGDQTAQHTLTFYVLIKEVRCEFKCSIKTGLSVYLNIVRNISLTLIQTEWNILKNDLSTMQTHENQSAKKKKSY